MISYRFKRRAFLTAMGGGLGLKIMLRNLEASAQGMRSPGRLLVTHWPVGIVAGSGDALWKPTAGSVGGSPGLKPFADAGLGPDMTVFRGLSTSHLTLTGGGGHEQGTVSLMTGQTPGGTRASCCEPDDAFAAPGGSFDQLLLENAPALRRPGKGYANSIVDSRTEFGEISTQCLSYSTGTSSVTKWSSDATAVQAAPLMPILSPLGQYGNLFGSFVPGAPGGRPVADATMRRLVRKKSVLDFAIGELDLMRSLAPGDAKSKLRIHTDEVLNAEQSLVATIDARYPDGSTVVGPGSCGAACTTKPPAPPDVAGGSDPAGGRGSGTTFSREMVSRDDSIVHQMAGKAHLDVLKAAFVCDLIRVATFQWSPGTNHVSFPLFPNTNSPYEHHPTSHRIGTADTQAASTPEALNDYARFLYNVQTWYFSRQAETFAAWKKSVDGCGNSLLDSTCVPFVTEVMATGHERSNMPGMIIGGKALGFAHNIYRAGSTIPVNDFWGTVGRALGHAGGGVFGPPIPGIWSQPA